MAYTLKLSANGQYILDTQDTFNTAYSQKINPSEFEAYTGQKATTPVNQPLVGTTSLAEQTQKVMRETPGQYQTVTDPITGETKTISKGQAITEIKDTISTLPTPTGTAARETSLDKVQRILAATPAQTGGISGSDYLKQIEAIQKSAQKAQLVNTLVKGGLDIGLGYLKQSMGGFQTGGYTGPVSTPLYGGSYAGGGGFIQPPVGIDDWSQVGGYSGGGFSPGAGAGFAAASTLLQTGDVGQAAKVGGGAYVGGAIGSAVGGPIGGAIGSAIGGSIGGGSVICTELNRQGLISKEDLKLNWNSMINKYTKDEIKGYWIWAMPMAEKMKTNKTLTKFWYHVMSHRIKDVKWKLGQGKFTLKGRVYSILMENISLVISKFIPKNKKVFI